MTRTSVRIVVAAAAVCIAVAGVQISALAATLTVGNPSTCPGATYPTISAAVAVASSGDTIRVCAGTYNENVSVTKPLTFRGAQAGKDARQGRTDPSKESIVNNASGDFSLTSTANHVTIDGFTISGAVATGHYGIEGGQGSSGLVAINDIISGNREGIQYQNPNGSMPSQINHDNFINNSIAGDNSGESGTGVFIVNGPANNTTITENDFTGDSQTAINFAGNPNFTDHSNNLQVTNNLSVNDATFVVATNSQNSKVANNTISVTSGSNGTAILDFGCNVNLSINNNMISGGAATGTSGINVRDLCGTPSVKTMVVNNHVANRYNGIRLTDDESGATVMGNQVMGSSNDGILDQTGSSNTFQNNQLATSAVHDCEDDTTGSGTAGTANQWKGNQGKSNNSSPAAICPS